VVDGEEAGAVLADAATGCRAAFGGCGSGCPRDEAGLGAAAEADVCSVAGDEEEFADRCAFALSVSSREAAMTQCNVRITHPRFRFYLRPALRKAAVQWRSCSWSSSPTGCLLGACSGQQPVGVCALYEEWCSPSANIEPRVRFF
jgi:hypothetical protein